MAGTGQEDLTVLLLADPGLPSRRAAAVRERLEQQLGHALRRPVSVATRTEMLRLNPDDSLDLDRVREAAGQDPQALTLMLTEIPRHSGGRPMIAEVVPEERIAVISCPTLGAVATRRRIVRTLSSSVLRLLDGEAEQEDRSFESSWSRWSHFEDTGRLLLLASTVTGGPRTVMGMVLGNDPWRTAPKLSSALAAAAATGAFGIFYTSIWEMSSYLPTERLLLIGALAIISMVSWLILSNALWDTPRRDNLATAVMFYNLSTVVTLLVCVLALYAVLVVLILFGAVVVIDPEFLSGEIGAEATFPRYLDIAWLSAAMGVVAGALGSSFDSDTDLRRITHGQRERQRRYTQDEQDRDRADDAGVERR